LAVTPKVTTYFDDAVRSYAELYGHYAFRNFGIAGDAVVAFVGPCDVRDSALVDLADRAAGEEIVAAAMLHFIIEHFGVGLAEAVWRQRLFAAIVFEEMKRRVPAAPLRRAGDDVFVGENKLTVSIATVAATSALIHFGVNVDGRGAPLTVADLSSLGVGAEAFGKDVMGRYAAEVAGVAAATYKVRGLCSKDT